MSLMHLHVTHDEIHKQIAICNDDYKFAAYPYSSLHEFALDDEVTVTIHFEMFSRNCEEVARSAYRFL